MDYVDECNLFHFPEVTYWVSHNAVENTAGEFCFGQGATIADTTTPKSYDFGVVLASRKPEQLPLIQTG